METRDQKVPLSDFMGRQRKTDGKTWSSLLAVAIACGVRCVRNHRTVSDWVMSIVEVSSRRTHQSSILSVPFLDKDTVHTSPLRCCAGPQARQQQGSYLSILYTTVAEIPLQPRIFSPVGRLSPK